MASLGVSLGMAISTGLLTGYITSRKWFQPPTVKGLFDDRYHWHGCEIEHDEQDKLGEIFEQNQDLLKDLPVEQEQVPEDDPNQENGNAI